MLWETGLVDYILNFAIFINVIIIATQELGLTCYNNGQQCVLEVYNSDKSNMFSHLMTLIGPRANVY